MNWTEILAGGGIPEPPGYWKTVALMQGRERPAAKVKVQLHAKKAPPGKGL